MPVETLLDQNFQPTYLSSTTAEKAFIQVVKKAVADFPASAYIVIHVNALIKHLVQFSFDGER